MISLFIISLILNIVLVFDIKKRNKEQKEIALDLIQRQNEFCKTNRLKVGLSFERIPEKPRPPIFSIKWRLYD